MRHACLIAGILSLTAAAHAGPPPASSGSGFYVNGQGWVVTNAHVVEECSAVSVPGAGFALEVRLDAVNDVAAVRMPGSGGAYLALKKEARLGEDVVVLGYPHADQLSDSVKVTNGLVSSLGGLRNDSRHLQISAPIQPGNSGGPVLDQTGLVAGMAVSIFTAGGDGLSSGLVPQNVNFAIKSSVIEAFLQSNGIAYHSASAGAQLSTADIAEGARAAVVQVLCHAEDRPVAMGESSSNPSASRSQAGSASEMAVVFALGFHAVWSFPNDEALELLATVYQGPLEYYGRMTAAADVFDEKVKFARRWPYRDYFVRPDTLSVACANSICSVSGMVDWHAYSPARNAVSSGVASFEFRVDVENMEILRETGKVISGARADATGMVARWRRHDEQCRNDYVTEDTRQACVHRDHTEESLHAHGWCQDRGGRWGRC